jgi:hypothetical protein
MIRDITVPVRLQPEHAWPPGYAIALATLLGARLTVLAPAEAERSAREASPVEAPSFSERTRRGDGVRSGGRGRRNGRLRRLLLVHASGLRPRR